MKHENIEISLDFNFESAHYMPNFSEGHPNRQIHGHSYQATVSLRGPIDPQTGVFIEYSDFKKIGDQIVSKLDHRLLNDLPSLEIPTSEHICQLLWTEFSSQVKGLYSISLKRPTLGLKISYFGPHE